MNFCTLFDSYYLDRGIALYNSLNNVMDDFTIYIYAFDALSYSILSDMNLDNAIIISENDILDEELCKIKKERSRTEYCWTCTPVIIQYSLNHFRLDYCVYIDADMYFYESPAVLLEEIRQGDGDVSIISHRFPHSIVRKTSRKQHGEYCVEFNAFFNNSNGKRILDWWKKRCFESCAMTLNDKSFGDQMYLNDWPQRFEHVYEMKNKGAGVAPWNVADFIFLNETDDHINLLYRKKEKCQLIFFHFQGLRFYDDGFANINIYNGIGKKDKKLIDFLYDNYIEELMKNRKLLKEKYSLIIGNPESRNKESKWKYTGMWDLFVYCILYINNLCGKQKNYKKVTEL